MIVTFDNKQDILIHGGYKKIYELSVYQHTHHDHVLVK